MNRSISIRELSRSAETRPASGFQFRVLCSPPAQLIILRPIIFLNQKRRHRLPLFHVSFKLFDLVFVRSFDNSNARLDLVLRNLGALFQLFILFACRRDESGGSSILLSEEVDIFEGTLVLLARVFDCGQKSNAFRIPCSVFLLKRNFGVLELLSERTCVTLGQFERSPERTNLFVQILIAGTLLL